MWAFAVVVIVAAAWALRLWGLGDGSLSHPEIFVPWIELPPGISAPPPRATWAEILWFHYHDEPHPMGWYLMMGLWTKLAGTSEWALRFPSTLFGALSVPVVFLLGRRVHGPGVGLLAAAALALHGFHIGLSQTARMYSAGTFWALLLTLLLVELARRPRPSPRVEAAYVLTAFLGAQTTELFLAVLLMQVGWAALFVPPAGPRAAAPRLLSVQALALMAAAVSLTHTIYRARHGAAADPSWEFLSEYLSFGFLFMQNTRSVPAIHVGAAAAAALLVAGVALAALGLREWRARPSAAAPATDPLPRWLGPLIALAAAALMVWLALIATRRNEYLLALAALPILALAVPGTAVFLRSRVIGRIPALDRALRAADPGVMLVALLGLGAPLLLFVVSFYASVTAPRAFLIFVPYLVLLAAAGALTLFRGRSARALAGAALVAVFALSVPYNAPRPQSPNDYKGLAQAIRAEMQPGDLVFVRKRNWVDTPFFYYMAGTNLVAEDYAGALADGPRRVWLVTWSPETDEAPEPGATLPDDRAAALGGLSPTLTLTARRARAELFLTGGEGAGP